MLLASSRCHPATEPHPAQQHDLRIAFGGPQPVNRLNQLEVCVDRQPSLNSPILVVWMGTIIAFYMARIRHDLGDLRAETVRMLL